MRCISMISSMVRKWWKLSGRGLGQSLLDEGPQPKERQAGPSWLMTMPRRKPIPADQSTRLARVLTVHRIFIGPPSGEMVTRTTGTPSGPVIALR
jgi:hypothetical protein